MNNNVIVQLTLLDVKLTVNVSHKKCHSYAQLSIMLLVLNNIQFNVLMVIVEQP
jgi:hypothetical protein